MLFFSFCLCFEYDGKLGEENNDILFLPARIIFLIHYRMQNKQKEKRKGILCRMF